MVRQLWVSFKNEEIYDYTCFLLVQKLGRKKIIIKVEKEWKDNICTVQEKERLRIGNQTKIILEITPQNKR